MLTGHGVLCLLSSLLLALYFFLFVFVLFVCVVESAAYIRNSIQIVWGG